MIFLANYAFIEGDIMKLTATFDSEGHACGVSSGAENY